MLNAYHFPGNVRELRSMVFDAVSRQSSPVLALAYFKEIIGKDLPQVQGEPIEALLTFSAKLPTITQANELLVEEAMKRARVSQNIAAGLLGILHQALNKRLKQVQ